MPTYAYKCSGCGTALERWQHFDDSPLTNCPTCGGSLRRIFQPVGVIFKGSGWYCTDNRPKSGTSGGSSDSKAGDTKASDTKSSESKSKEASPAAAA